MGYCARLDDAKFFIAEENKYEAYRKLKKDLYDVNGVQKARCLEDVLKVYGFDSWLDSDDNICDIDFIGDKLWDEEILFNLLAPFVKDGSYIEMFGEDGERWRWTFNNGQFKTITAKVVWEDNDEE